MPSLDKFPVTPEGQVYCPLRQRAMPLVECLDCGRLIEVEPGDRPTHIVCEARYAVSFLGLDDDP